MNLSAYARCGRKGWKDQRSGESGSSRFDRTDNSATNINGEMIDAIQFNASRQLMQPVFDQSALFVILD